MTYHFGIRPWELERLTFDEIRFYQDALRDLSRESAKARAREL